MSDWGKAIINNIDWGKSATNSINWGDIYANSLSGDTLLLQSGFANTHSLLLDGVDANAKTDSNYTVLDGAQKFTISMWVKPSATETKILLSTIRNGTQNNFQVCIATHNGSVRLFTETTGNYIYTATGELSNNVWSNIIVACDLSKGNALLRGDIYINGILKTIARNLKTSLLNSSSKLTFAVNENGKYSEFTGSMDEVAIWNGTDLRSDIATIYNGGVPSDLSQYSTPPTNWWRMGETDGGTGTVLTDAIGSANATLFNLAEYSTDVPT